MLLNDQQPIVVFRNIALLLILSTVSDEITAAEIALHALYSAFIPTEYELKMMGALRPFLEGKNTELKTEGDKKKLKISLAAPLGPASSFSGALSPHALVLFYPMIRNQLGTTKAREELKRVR